MPIESLRRTVIPLALLALLYTGFTWAETTSAQAAGIDWLQLGLGLFGGIALFLAGLELLADGLKKAAGNALKDVLSRLTTNRFMGAVTGAFVTGVLNSSTVTTLLVVGFISGGMMTLAQSVGVIMGANIGSTVTAQLLAFNLSEYSLGPVAIGFFMLFSAKRDKVKHYGMMLMGIGLVFYGMGLMGESMTPLRSYEPFLAMLREMENPVMGILAGALFTAVVQSSAATVGIAIAMASEGLLSLPAGIALALGANVGTAVTTALMGILSSKSTDAVRASVVHVAFNVLGTLVWLPLIWLLVDIAVWVSPTSPELEGMARSAAEVPRQIANANTLFNVINTLLFIGFTGLFARMAERLVPDKPVSEDVIIEPQFLDRDVLTVPSLALERVRMEFGRSGAVALSMYTEWSKAMQDRDREHLAEIARRDDQVDILEAEILNYLGQLRQSMLTEEEARLHQDLLTATVNLEGLADVIETDMVALAENYIEKDLQTGETTRALLRDMYVTIGRSVELAVKAVRDGDQRAAEDVVNMKADVARSVEAFLSRKSERIGTQDENYLASARAEMSLVDKLRRIYTLAKRIAKVVLPEPVALKG